MKLATSTGDFSWYADTVPEKVRNFKGTKFKYINLELTGKIPELSEKDGWKALAEKLRESASHAGVTYVVAHAPCLHFAVPEAMENPENEAYRNNVNAIRNAMEVCNTLGIRRIVIHACIDQSFSREDFYRYNAMFFREFFDLAEKYNITIMTENWDDNSTHFSTGREMRDFIDYINHPLLAACWDTAHGNIDETSRNIGQYENIVALGDKLKGLHISDNFGDTHHHSWPFAGIINFDSVVQGLIDVGYDGYFTFEASYTLLHEKNLPYNRKPWEYNGKIVTGLLNPSVELKQKAVDLLFETGRYVLETYGLFEE